MLKVIQIWYKGDMKVMCMKVVKLLEHYNKRLPSGSLYRFSFLPLILLTSLRILVKRNLRNLIHWSSDRVVDPISFSSFCPDLLSIYGLTRIIRWAWIQCALGKQIVIQKVIRTSSTVTEKYVRNVHFVSKVCTRPTTITYKNPQCITARSLWIVYVVRASPTYTAQYKHVRKIPQNINTNLLNLF